MPLGVQQPTVIVLTMQFNQRFGQRAQHFTRTAAVIDPSRLAPVRRVDAPQDQLIPRRQPRFFQYRAGGMIGRQIKPRGHFALCRTLPHQIGPTAPAQHKTQTVQQDRLARTGFARQHVKPRLKRKFQPVNDQHV